MSMRDDIKRIVGERLPYVYVEKIKIVDTDLLDGDLSRYEENTPRLIRNKFGSNQKLGFDQQENANFQTDNPYEVQIKLKVPELLNNRRWYQIDASDLIINIIQSSHPDLTEFLLNQPGVAEENIPNNLKKFFIKKSVSVLPNLNLISYKTREIQEDSLCMLPVDISFKSNSDHLSYFIYSRLGTTDGFRTVERVLDNRRANNTSVSYYLPNGELWAGPVHMHEGMWMAGARHTRRAHPTLERVVHNNVKIQDLRIFRVMEELQNGIVASKVLDKRKKISKLFLSRDRQSAARGLFIVNMERVLREDTRFNGIVNAISIDKLLSYMEIQTLKIVRSRFQDGKPQDYALVAESSDNRGSLIRRNYFVDTNNDGIVEDYIGSVAEKRLAGLDRKRAFSFYDHKIASFEQGKYQYGIELVAKDPTIPFMKLQIRGLKKALLLLEEYLSIIGNKQFFDSTGALSDRAVTLLGKLYGSRERTESVGGFSEFPWRRAVKIYFNVLANLTGRNYSRAARRLYPIIGPSARNTEGLEIFMNLISSLIQKLETLTPAETTTYSLERSKVKSSRKLDITNIKILHNFDSLFDTGVMKGYGLDYYGDSLTQNYTGPLSIPLASIFERFRTEANKRGIQVPPKESVEDFRNFYSKIQPLQLYVGNEKYVLEDDKSEQYNMAKIHFLSLKSQEVDSIVRSPLPGRSTREMLEQLSKKPGSSFNVRRRRRRRKDDPCDPTAATTKQPERANEDGSLFPDKEKDPFNFNFQNDDTESDPVVIDPVSDIAYESVLETDTVNPFKDREEKLSYVLSFDDELEPVTVEAPFNSSEPYLVILQGKTEESETDNLNEVIIIDNSSPQQEPSVEKEPTKVEETPTVETEEPKEPDYIEEPEASSTELPDNSEGVADSIYNTGAEIIAERTMTVAPRARRAERARNPVSVETRTESQQTFLVGRRGQGGTNSGGSTGGY